MRVALIITTALILQSCNTTDSIVQFSEENTMDKEYYIYPSSLRMMNLKESEEFNQAIEGFIEGQYFSIKNTQENTELIEQLEAKMQKDGYEEAMTINNKQRKVKVYILEQKTLLTSAVIRTDSTYDIVRVEGAVNPFRIMELAKDFNQQDYLNIIDVIQQQKNNPRHEHNPHN